MTKNSAAPTRATEPRLQVRSKPGKQDQTDQTVMQGETQRMVGQPLLSVNAFLQGVLDSLSAHIAILDKSGVIMQVNAAWRTFGELNGLQTNSHCLGINYLELCDSASGQNSEEASLTSRAIRDVLAAVQQEARIEYPCDSPNEKLWFLLKVTKFEADGEVWAVLAHENITERKRAEQALMEKEEQYRAIAESSSDYIMRYDRNFKHIYANRIALESTGLPVEQYIGKTHHEMGFPEHLCKLWEQHIQSVFDTGKSSQMEFAVEMVPGTMHLDLVFNPEFSPDGNVNSVIGISRNISERKQAEAQKQAAFEALQQKNDEMERFQHITIGRELRMIELKKEINHLLQQTGLPEKYRIVDQK